MKTAAIALWGLVIGSAVGCEAMRLAVIPDVILDAARAWCLKPIGACGAKSVWFNRCTGHVEIHAPDGVVVEHLRAFEIADRPGVEQLMSPADSAAGAHVDQPKITKDWRCKKRGKTMYCHLYRRADSAFGAFVKERFLSLTDQPYSRKWCSTSYCEPMEVGL
jgi:hypothetical protein